MTFVPSSVKALPKEDRPRERLLRYGSDALSQQELLAILLGCGTVGKPVLTLARELLTSFGSLERLSQATLPELSAIKGVGRAKAIQIQAAFALFRKLHEGAPPELLDSPKKIYEAIYADFLKETVEVLLLLLLDVKRRCIHREFISRGTLTELLLHPREILHVAIRHRAHTFVIAHNHPSGDPTPSLKDLEMTKSLAEAARLVGIALYDHLIVGRGHYVSLRERGVV